MKNNQRDPSMWLDQINKNRQLKDYNQKKAIICDLDGTLAFPTDRTFYEEEKCKNDIVNFPVAKIISMYMEDGYTILFTSGRQEKGRIATTEWLQTHLVNTFIGNKHKLFMRKDKDMHSDNIVKEEIYNNFIKDFYYVEAVFDDRPSICRTWWKLGLFVFKCHQSDEEF